MVFVHYEQLYHEAWYDYAAQVSSSRLDGGERVFDLYIYFKRQILRSEEKHFFLPHFLLVRKKNETVLSFPNELSATENLTTVLFSNTSYIFKTFRISYFIEKNNYGLTYSIFFSKLENSINLFK